MKNDTRNNIYSFHYNIFFLLYCRGDISLHSYYYYSNWCYYCCNNGFNIFIITIHSCVDLIWVFCAYCIALQCWCLKIWSFLTSGPSGMLVVHKPFKWHFYFGFLFCLYTLQLTLDLSLIQNLNQNFIYFA